MHFITKHAYKTLFARTDRLSGSDESLSEKFALESVLVRLKQPRKKLLHDADHHPKGAENNAGSNEPLRNLLLAR